MSSSFNDPHEVVPQRHSKDQLRKLLIPLYIARLLAISLKMAHTGKVKKTLHLDEKLQFYSFQFIRFLRSKT